MTPAAVFGVIAGGTGIAATTLHVARKFANDLRKIQGGPGTVRSLRDNILNLQTSLESLVNVDKHFLAELGIDVTTSLRDTIAACQASIKRMHVDFKEYMQSTEDADINAWTKVAIGFFKDQQIQTMLAQFEGCKSSINVMASIANVRSAAQTREAQKILIVSQTRNTSALMQVQQQLRALESDVNNLRVTSPGSGGGEDPTGDDEELRAQLKEAIREFEAVRKLLDLLQANMEERENGARANSYYVTNAANNYGIVTAHLDNSTFNFGKPQAFDRRNP